MIKKLWKKLIGIPVLVREYDGAWIKRRAFMLTEDACFVKYKREWYELHRDFTFANSHQLREWRYRI